jgi:hypothetical protein
MLAHIKMASDNPPKQLFLLANFSRRVLFWGLKHNIRLEHTRLYNPI